MRRTTEESWDAWLSKRDPKAMDELLRHYRLLPKNVVTHMKRGLARHIDPDELESYGLLGLYAAIEKYDPAKNDSFEPYAWLRIKGAIVDGIREFDAAPQSVRARSRNLEESRNFLAVELGREATADDIAKDLGVSVDQVRRWESDLVAQGIFNPITLDSLTFDQGGPDIEDVPEIEDNRAGPGDSLDLELMRDRLTGAVGVLSQRETVVLFLYYHEGKTLAEVAAELGVGETRVSQIQQQAVAKLRARMLPGASLAEFGDQ